MVNFVLLIIGILISSAVALHYKDEMFIVAGADWVATALMRMLLWGDVKVFFRSLVVTGVSIPLVAGYISPIFYYSDSWRLEPFLEMAGIAFLPGLILVIFGLKGLKKLRKAENIQSEEERYKDLYPTILEPTKETLSLRRMVNVAIFLMVFSFTLGNVGLWEVAVLLVIVNSLIILYVIFLALYNYIKISAKVMAQITAVIGLTIAVLCVILILTQQGRVSFMEAAPGIVIGTIMFVLGGLISIGETL